MPDTLIHFGGSIKALDDSGKVGGYLVRFTDASRKDLSGDYFTAKTYLGAHNGDGVDTLFHHGLSVKDGFDKYADHLFTPLKAKKDDIGIWAETILDMADEYEKAVFELVKSGKLGWSSGATGHMVKRAEDGELLRWPIAEGSLTPTPCEPMNRAISLKSYQESITDDPLARLSFAEKLSHALAAVEGVTKQAREIHELRKGESRRVTLNEDRRARLSAIKSGIDELLTECAPFSDEAFQLEAEFLCTQARIKGVAV